ncbi:MAG: hypothetical protein HY791_12265 [Deltaproteobacteria bacterium]|nr:hypothetical protein [Deltaproteobacteria bacterium]
MEPSTDLQRGLTSLAWLKHGDGMSEGMRVRRFFEASAFTAWLTNEACAHYDHVYSELAERLGGDPLELTVRSLLAEAWLGGDTHPGSSELDQWRAARNKPVTQPSAGTPGGDAKRSEAWQTLAEKCDRFWTALLELDLHRVGQKPQREGNGLVDGARVLAAVRDVAKDPERWPLGPGAFPQGLKFGPVREVLTFMQQDFEKALAAEDDRVRSLANTVVQSTGGADADAFLGQLLEVTKRLETLDRDLVPAAISQPFHSECAVLSDKGLPLGSATWVQLNDQIRDLASASDSAPVAEKLTRLVSVNHAMLAAVARAAGTGDRLLDETSRRATSWVEAADKGQAQKVREYGKRLQAAGTKIQKEVQK